MEANSVFKIATVWFQSTRTEAVLGVCADAAAATNAIPRQILSELRRISVMLSRFERILNREVTCRLVGCRT